MGGFGTASLPCGSTSKACVIIVLFTLACRHSLSPVRIGCIRTVLSTRSLFKSRRLDGAVSAHRFTFSSASRDESMYPGLNLALIVGINDFVRLPNSLGAGLVYRPSVGVLRILSRAIHGSSPELLTLPLYHLRTFHSCFRCTLRLTVARADCFMCETPVQSECLESV